MEKLSLSALLDGHTLLIDKPLGWTSFDVVAKIRNATRCKKIGHAGTLDPLATGLLILCTGKQTKGIQVIQDAPKRYTLTFSLGGTTPSYDAEFPPEHIQDASHIGISDIEAGMLHFTGVLDQTPPAYSAIKTGGKRAYALARSGKEVVLASRKIEIYSFRLLAFHSSDCIEAEVHCQKGTYIRSLVHDLGQHLGVGAWLTGLRRTEIGSYSVADAVTPEVWLQQFQAEGA
jgi:tRNA pseudouridine55 synthase